MALIVIAILISTAMNMAMPQISTKTLFDDVLSKVGSTPAQQLLVTLGYLIGAVVGMKLLGLLMTVSFQFLMGSIMPRVIYDIKSRFSPPCSDCPSASIRPNRRVRSWSA